MLEKTPPMQDERSAEKMNSLLYEPSPIGLLRLEADENGVCRIAPVEDRSEPERPCPLLEQTAAQLQEYFAGARRCFDLPLSLHGTPFQLRVWRALCDIPYGETRSYSEIAQAVGAPNACRAVGMANHVNPVIIVVPCHRVIRADGSLGGYGIRYGDGPAVKKYLLGLESN